jgi:hypothetical protein
VSGSTAIASVNWRDSFLTYNRRGASTAALWGAAAPLSPCALRPSTLASPPNPRARAEKLASAQWYKPAMSPYRGQRR